jgi:CubicO group peptidase (beta-lactamase class C family)
VSADRRRGWRIVLVALGIALAAASCTSGSGQAPRSGSFPAAHQISRYLDGLAARGRLSGTVLVTRGRMSYAAAFGYADRQARMPNTMRTDFRLGSVSKQFTAMGVLMLAARHQLSVTDPICRDLPGCPTRWKTITIAELLTHTSGIPDYLNELSARWPPQPATPAQLIASFRNAPLHFAPGTRMRYSNSGYVLLGALIEHLTRQPLAQFLRHSIFGPLGMTRTGTDITAVGPGHARGYYASGQQPVLYPMSAFFADGGIYSDAADLRRWDRAIEHSTLIPAALTRQMLSVRVPCPPPGAPGGCLTSADLGYGYGWFIDHTRYGPLYQHVGRIDGYHSFNGIYLDRDESIIILANSESTNVLAISNAVAGLTLGG